MAANEPAGRIKIDITNSNGSQSKTIYDGDIANMKATLPTDVREKQPFDVDAVAGPSKRLNISLNTPVGMDESDALSKLNLKCLMRTVGVIGPQPVLSGFTLNKAAINAQGTAWYNDGVPGVLVSVWRFEVPLDSELIFVSNDPNKSTIWMLVQSI